MRATLANLGENQSEEFFQVVLINSLPSEFGDFLGTWEMMHPSMKTTEFLLTCLQQKEQRLRKDDGQALLVKGFQKDWKIMSIEERKKVSKCKNCGGLRNVLRPARDRAHQQI